jgi:nucleoside 2-deoxyribosyltransferase
MKITICGSMVFSEKQLEVKSVLEDLGHEVFISRFTGEYVGKTDGEIASRTIHNKKANDAMTEHWELIKKSDAILVLNYPKNGIDNYVGGNTFLEIGFAHVLKKRIFLLNRIPEIGYRSEIEAANPVVLNGDLALIR